MRPDPNHYYRNVAEFRELLETGKFIETDVRSLDVPRVVQEGRESGIFILAAKRLFSVLIDDALDLFEEEERRVIAECSTRMREALRSLQTQMQNNNNVAAAPLQDFVAGYQKLNAIVSSAFMSRYLQGQGQFNALQRRLLEESKERDENLNLRVGAAISEVELKSEQTIARIQRDLSEHAVSKNANAFHTEASRYAHLAVWWGIICAVWFVLLISGAATIAFYAPLSGRFLGELRVFAPGIPDQWLLLHALASKAIVAGALAYVGVVLVKAFMSVLNSHVVNRHRAVSLDTYRFLLDGAQSDQDRQAIIQRAAEAVFAMQETGLIKSVPGSDITPLSTTINLPKF
jgi:hypothetical protein